MPSQTNEVDDRFLIKLSGEVFPAVDQYIDAAPLESVSAKLLLAWYEDPQFAVVVGGGFFEVVAQHTAPSIESMLST